MSLFLSKDQSSESSGSTRKGLTRRRFLLAGVGVSGVAVAWRLLSAPGGIQYAGLKTFSQTHACVLAAAYKVIAPACTAEQEQEAILFLDDFVSQLDAMQRFQLGAALQLLEHTPLIFHGYLPRFSRLDAERQANCLNGWRYGGAQRQPLYAAVKELVCMAHYSRDWSWKAIGYNGPMVSVEAGLSPRDKFYESLLVKGDAL